MARYLKVSPAAVQTEIRDVETAGYFSRNASLGYRAGEKVWDKKYKLRITSKLTGKKIDINFTFRQNPLDTENWTESE